MHADIKGALEWMKVPKHYNNMCFEHKGIKLTGDQTKKVLEYGLSKGYKTTAELSDDEVDKVLGLHETFNPEKQASVINLANKLFGV